jgi:hypothetical protein
MLLQLPYSIQQRCIRTSRVSSCVYTIQEDNASSSSGGSSSAATATDDDVAVNAWLGPANTSSPCHTDPTHNLLCQVSVDVQ